MKFGVGVIRSIIGKLAILFAVFIIFSTTQLASSNSWPMFLHGPQHTGNTTSIAPDTNTTLWTVPAIGGNGWSSPTVANGRVFVNQGGTIYGLYEFNGTQIWNQWVGFGGQACSTPAISGDKVYIVGDRLYCFYVNNGIEVWNKSVGPSPGTSSPTVSEDKVFVYTGTLYCFYASNGTDIWNISLGGNGESTPAVAEGKVFSRGWLAGMGDRLYCLYANNGSEIWNISGGGFNSPTVVNGKVFYNPSEIKCLYASNATEIWSQPNGGDGYSSPAVANGKVFIHTWDRVKCYYENNGTEIWNVPMEEGQGCSTPAISSDGKLFILGWDNSLGGITYCLNESDGAVIWSYITGGAGLSSPAIANGRIFVNEGTIYCFGKTSTIDYILIRDEPGGAGNEIPNLFVDVGTVVNGYAAAYNGTDWLFDIPVNWSVTNDPSTNASTNPTFFVTSSDFYSGFYEGTAIWTADDGNGHTDNVTFWVNPPGVDYIQIVDTEGTGTAEIGDKIVDVGNSTKGYAASFNDTTEYIGDIPVTWSVINTSGAEGSTNPVSGTNSTVYVGIKGGNVEWIANDGFGHTDSVNFTVRDPQIDHIVIMTGPNGTGSWVGDSTFVYGNSTTFYAGGFNETSGWVEDVPASWNSNNSFIGDVDPGPSNSTTFITLNNGTCNITATYNTFSNTTGVLTVINYTVDYIIIRDASNNGGAWVGDRSFNVGETTNFFAAAYNYSAPGDGYIGDISVVWESSDSSIGTVTTPGASTLFTAKFLSGECNVTAIYGFISNTTSRLTVLPADLDYIVITDAPNGNELITVYLNVGESLQIYASGYNSTGPTYIGPVNVDWTQSPLTIGSFSQSPGISTIFTAGMSGGSTTIMANHTLSAMNDDFTIIIYPPTVDYIQIRDAADGLGNIVTTSIYIVNETDQFYAAAYNNTANYLYDVFVFWYSNDTDVGQVTPQGVWTNFTAMHVDLDSTCTVNATLDPQISNSTGPLIVLTPRVDYIQIRDESGGEGNVTTTPYFTLGENVTDIYYCAAYNYTVGYIGDRSVQWTVTGDIGTLSPSTGDSTIFTATTAGTGIIRANLTGIINSTGTITVIQVPDTTSPEAPTGLQVSQVEGGGALRLTWDENTEHDLAGYNIYRSLQNDSGFELINTEGLVTGTSYLDTGLTNGTIYYYKITAVDEASNESPFSDTVHNTPIAEGEEDEEEFPMLLILLPIIIIIVLILLILLFKRRKSIKAPTKPEIEKKELPPPPSWMLEKEEETISVKEEMPSEGEIPEEKSPITEDEEIPEDDLPPPEDWEEELPPPKDEIP